MPFDEKKYQKEYREKNKEKHKEYCKQYYQDNRDKLLNSQKERDKLRQDEIKKYVRSKSRLKSSRIRHWREYNMLYDGTMEELHELYDNTKECQLCHFKFNEDNSKNNHDRKVAEHDHLSRYFRSICCQRCNMKVAAVDRKRYILLLEIHRYHNTNTKTLIN